MDKQEKLLSEELAVDRCSLLLMNFSPKARMRIYRQLVSEVEEELKQPEQPDPRQESLFDK